MRLVSFVRAGQSSYGIVTDGGIVDLGRRLGGRYADLRGFLAGGAAARNACDPTWPADVALGDVALLPVVPNPDKIVCVGLNYRAHVAETGRADSDKPAIFLRLAASQVGHGQAMIRPRVSTEFDYEGELALVIGKAGRAIAPERAYEHIAGYACYNDGSVRDWQRHTHQWAPGKNFPGTGAFGPWLVTADEIGDPTAQRLTTRLNGAVVQDTTVDLLIFPIPELVAYVSAWTELVPGDVIVTGTPGGVGMKRQPPLFMKAGDVVEVEISKIGTLANPIVDEAGA